MVLFMANPSYGFCEKSEFDKYKEKRLKEDELHLETLYIAYFALKRADKTSKRREAAKFPATILDKALPSSLGVYAITLVMPGINEPLLTELLSMDGLTTSEKGLYVVDKTVAPNPRYPVTMGYFKRHQPPETDGREDEEGTYREVYLPNRELVPA
jgi:hypothetical protein